MCGKYVTIVLLAAWVSVCRLELRNLSRLQPMSGTLKLAACHEPYLYNTGSLVSQLVSYFKTDFYLVSVCPALHQKITTSNGTYIEIVLMYLCMVPISSLRLCRGICELFFWTVLSILNNKTLIIMLLLLLTSKERGFDNLSSPAFLFLICISCVVVAPPPRAQR